MKKTIVIQYTKSEVEKLIKEHLKLPSNSKIEFNEEYRKEDYEERGNKTFVGITISTVVDEKGP